VEDSRGLSETSQFEGQCYHPERAIKESKLALGQFEGQCYHPERVIKESEFALGQFEGQCYHPERVINESKVALGQFEGQYYHPERVIKESKFALVWKTLVAYQKLVSLKVSATIQRKVVVWDCVPIVYRGYR
jgi:hypothetical protein